MKKFFPLLISLTLLFSLSQKSEAQIEYGAGLFYGGYLNNPGLNLRAELDIFEGFSVVPMVDISVPNFNSGTLLNSVSVHLHYSLEVVDRLYIYPLAGAAIKSYLDFDRVGNNRVYHNFALNPVGGAGGKLEVSDGFALFGEFKLELGRYSQLMSTFGILIKP